MRVIISMSGLIVTLALIVMINCAIVNKHVRDMEISNGIESAIDYAVDKMQDIQVQLKSSTISKEAMKEQVILAFCLSLEAMLTTDGE